MFKYLNIFKLKVKNEKRRIFSLITFHFLSLFVFHFSFKTLAHRLVDIRFP
jgi:hypothetical protein